MRLFESAPEQLEIIVKSGDKTIKPDSMDINGQQIVIHLHSCVFDSANEFEIDAYNSTTTLACTCGNTRTYAQP